MRRNPGGLPTLAPSLDNECYTHSIASVTGPGSHQMKCLGNPNEASDLRHHKHLATTSLSLFFALGLSQENTKQLMFTERLVGTGCYARLSHFHCFI